MTASEAGHERFHRSGARRPTVQWLGPEEDREWDAFVARHPHGWVYHLSGWKRVLEETFPHIRGNCLVARDADGVIQAGLPVHTVSSWLLGRRLVSLPFASVCDPLVGSGEEFLWMLPELLALQGASRSRRIEVRAMRTADHLAQSGFGPHTVYKHHYLRLDRSPEELLASFAKSSIRQKMKQAAQAGVTVERREDETAMRVCHSILSETRRRLSLPVLPFAFFHNLRRRMGPEHVTVFLALHQHQAVAFHLILKFKDLWISEHSGNINGAVNGTNQLLYWETIREAQREGARKFSFGRTSASNEGLLSYKRRWAPVEEDIYEFVYPASEKSRLPEDTAPREQSLAYRSMRSFLSHAPMPLYRMVGRYCYRHLG